MHDIYPLDRFDHAMLAQLQADARLTNAELADRIGLSASQCSRRRMRLEEAGYIAGYHAHLDRERCGFGLTSFISVTLAAHNAGNAKLLAELLSGLPEVLEAHATTGEMDYLVKVAVADLKALSSFINDKLLSHPVVQNVKTSVALETLKETGALPLE